MPTRSRSAKPPSLPQTTAISPPKWDSLRWLPRIAPRTRGSTCSDSCRSTSTRLHPPATAALKASRRSSAVFACASRSPVTTHIPCPTRDAWNRAFIWTQHSLPSGCVKPIGEAFGRACQPRLDDDLLEDLDADLLEPDQHRCVALEVRDREEDLGIVRDQRLLRDQVLHARAEDRPVRRRRSERREVALAQ